MNARLLLYHFIRKCSYVMKKLREDRTATKRKITDDAYAASRR